MSRWVGRRRRSCNGRWVGGWERRGLQFGWVGIVAGFVPILGNGGLGGFYPYLFWWVGGVGGWVGGWVGESFIDGF